MHFYTNDVVATSKIPILSPRVRFPVGVFFLPLCPLHPPCPPWAETRSHEYPRLAGEATDFGCVRRSDLGRARDFWCWNDLEWTACTRVTGHRTDTMIILFCSISRSDAGSRRWRQKDCSSPLARSWPAREDSSTRELASPKLVSATAPTQQCDWRCELAINESKKMAALARREQLAALARSEHERAARRLPAAALFAVCA